MEIRCEHCNAKLNIPDEKIPQGQRVSISCPKCKNKMTIDARNSDEDDIPVPQNEKSDMAKAYESESAIFQSYGRDTDLALGAISDPDLGEKIGQAIEEMGYKYIPAENTNQAISKMRFHNFRMIILSDNFDGIALDQSPILQYLNHLPMSLRRKMFVALIGDVFNTMDHMMAFATSTNLVINRRDVDNLAGILSNAIADNDQFYEVFRDTLAEVGRA